MNLISCAFCGTVINKSRIPEPEIWDKKGKLIPNSYSFTYVEDEKEKDYHPIINCPVCIGKILYRTGDMA